VGFNDVPNSLPITYMVDGRQYVALTGGNSDAQSTTFRRWKSATRPDRGAASWVFELEE
jgi:hypothetical protein